ncbi:GNAT family N-acetyltransferase [Arthrobacter sp. 35W]|uniref:GNAT family N-acetyltransferase n=1 Tax=Arthrobacter sp. 35W TaxID=1132441 RepID=UPI0004162B5B|nr:GNAT family N-acetyltransferase [Arthrobacter sp. 35W]
MLEIRPAALSELSLLPAIEAESDAVFDDAGTGIRAVDLPPPATVAEFSEALHIMVAGRPPVGFARVEEVDGQAHLEQLSVVPQWQGRGIGRALVDAALAWARESGYHYVTLTTYADIAFNGPFYASCGFRPLAGDLGPELARIRDEEKLLGLDALGTRAAMVHDLQGA